MSMAMTIFDVGRGQCIAIRTPNNHLVLVDCGCSDDFSPVQALAANRGLWAGRDGYALTQLIISHPHTDHIADIESLTRLMPPSMIVRRTDVNITRVAGNSAPSTAFRHYRQVYLPPQYTSGIPIGTYPDWGDGCQVLSYWLDEPRANQVSANDNSYINNTSIVTIVKYKGYAFAITGDMETEGIAALLLSNTNFGAQIIKTNDLFGQPVGGVHFLVTPHHGHPSGFSTTWFEWTGPTRIFNVVSERRLSAGEDPSRARVDTRYSDAQFSLANNREGRCMVSTRADGHISITINDDGTWQWQGIKL